jgi:hypothetical protein
MFANTAFAVVPFSTASGEAFQVSVSENIGAIADAESFIAKLQAAVIETMFAAETQSSTLTAIWTVIDTSQTPPDPNWQTIVNP